MNVTLEVGTQAQTVTLASAQQMINTTRPNNAGVINNRATVDLPIGGREPIQLAGVEAGIAVDGTDV
ncbi:hypothetical protein NL529_29040, partial [Klebsiella pneumoniae]|nr:hypothetical protein [Klebsiella pneumoniae]